MSSRNKVRALISPGSSGAALGTGALGLELSNGAPPGRTPGSDAAESSRQSTSTAAPSAPAATGTERKRFTEPTGYRDFAGQAGVFMTRHHESLSETATFRAFRGCDIRFVPPRNRSP